MGFWCFFISWTVFAVKVMVWETISLSVVNTVLFCESLFFPLLVIVQPFYLFYKLEKTLKQFFSGLQTFSTPPTLHVVSHAYLMLAFPLPPLQMQCRLSRWLVCRLSTSLVSGVSQLGEAGSCIPLLSSLFLDKTNHPPLEYTACPRPCCLDQHSSSPDWGERSSCTRFTFYWLIPPSPTHAAPSPWCCHNGNEMNCKWPTHFFTTWTRFKMYKLMHHSCSVA